MHQNGHAWNRLWSLMLVLILAVALPASEPRPNVIVIMTDDLGYGDLGCYGATRVKTPYIDRLAHDGVRCSDAHSAAAISPLSAYSVLSGEYSNRVVRKGTYQTYFREQQVTLPGLLHAAGYITAFIGSWHTGFGRGAEPDYNRPDLLANVPGASAWTPLDLGFESFFGLPRSHDEPPAVCVETTRDALGKTFLRVVAGDPADPLVIHPPEKNPNRRRPDDFGQGYSTGASKAHAARNPAQIDPLLTDHAVDFLEQRAPGEAFFLMVSFTAPHVPVIPAATFRGSSQAGAYGDIIQQLDACVGRITTTLALRDLDRNTLLVFTSSNGGFYVGKKDTAYLDQAQIHRPNGILQGQKTDCWEGGHRIPLIVRWPAGRIPADTICDRLIGLVDLPATIAAACGLSIPEGAAVDSLDQLPLLKEPVLHPPIRREMLIQGSQGFMLRATDEQGRPWAFLPMRGTGGETVVDSTPTIPWGQPYKTLRFINSDIVLDAGTGRSRIRTDAPGQQLYDLTADVSQQVNVAMQYTDWAARLDTRLKELLAKP